jgi:hypothetical protein
VSFAKGIIYLCEYSLYLSIGLGTDPKADGIKDIADDTWKSLQPNLPVNILNVVFFKDRFNPGKAILATYSMVLIEE